MLVDYTRGNNKYHLNWANTKKKKKKAFSSAKGKAVAMVYSSFVFLHSFTIAKDLENNAIKSTFWSEIER